MRIRTQFIAAVILFGLVLAAISASAIITNYQVAEAGKQDKIAESIVEGASELGYLANDYVMYGESQQLDRWRARFARFSADVAGLQVLQGEQRALIRSIQANAQRLEDVFDSVVSAGGGQSQNQDGTVTLTMIQISWSRMAVQSQGLVSDATRLSQLLDQRTDRLQRTNSIVIMVLIGVLVAYFLVNYWLIQRHMLESIANLQAGTTVIGSGNLDFRIQEKRNDEIGDLSRAFNRMTADLKTATTEVAVERRRLYNVMETLPTMICLLTPDYHVAWANRSFRERFGESHGRRCYEYCFGCTEPCEFCESYRVLDTGVPHHWECTIPDGASVIDIYNFPFTDADGSPLILEMGIDITERKRAEAALQELNETLDQRVATRTAELHESEARYRSLFSSMAEGFGLQEIILDAEGRPCDYRFLELNDAFGKLTGLSPEQAIGRTVREVLPDVEPFWIETYGRVALTGEPVHFEAFSSALGRHYAVSAYRPAENQFACTFLDITERRALEEALRVEANERAILEERQRLARDLHDAVSQTLFSASLVADVLPRLWERDPGVGQQSLSEIRKLTRGALAETRALLLELRPSALEHARLKDLITQLGEAFAAKLQVKVDVSEAEDCPLPPDVQVGLYRIAQEALTNVYKHASASEVVITLRCVHGESTPVAIDLCISDDGRGFDVQDIPPGRLGLGIMHERARAIGAELHIDSQVEHGTRVRVIWPGDVE